MPLLVIRGNIMGSCRSRARALKSISRIASSSRAVRSRGEPHVRGRSAAPANEIPRNVLDARYLGVLTPIRGLLRRLREHEVGCSRFPRAAMTRHAGSPSSTPCSTATHWPLVATSSASCSTASRARSTSSARSDHRGPAQSPCATSSARCIPSSCWPDLSRQRGRNVRKRGTTRAEAVFPPPVNVGQRALMTGNGMFQLPSSRLRFVSIVNVLVQQHRQPPLGEPLFTARPSASLPSTGSTDGPHGSRRVRASIHRQPRALASAATSPVDGGRRLPVAGATAPSWRPPSLRGQRSRAAVDPVAAQPSTSLQRRPLRHCPLGARRPGSASVKPRRRLPLRHLPPRASVVKAAPALPLRRRRLAPVGQGLRRCLLLRAGP